MSDELAREHVETLLAAAQELAEACILIGKQLRPDRRSAPWSPYRPDHDRTPAARAADLLEQAADSTGETRRLLRAVLGALSPDPAEPVAARPSVALAVPVPPPPLQQPPTHQPPPHQPPPHQPLYRQSRPQPWDDQYRDAAGPLPAELAAPAREDELYSEHRDDSAPGGSLAGSWNPPYGGSVPSTGGSASAYLSDAGAGGRHALDETGAWRLGDIVGPSGGRHSVDHPFPADDGSTVDRATGPIGPGRYPAPPAHLVAPFADLPIGAPVGDSVGDSDPVRPEAYPAWHTAGATTESTTGDTSGAAAPATGAAVAQVEPPDATQLAVTVRQVEASRRHLQAALLALRDALGGDGDVSLLALVERSLSAVAAATDQLRDALEPRHAEQVLPGEARYCCPMPWQRLRLVPADVALAPATAHGTSRVLVALGYDAQVGATVDGQPQVTLTGPRLQARVVPQQLRLAGSGEWQAYLDWTDQHGQQRSEAETLGPAELTDDELARRVDDALRRRLS